MRWTGHDGLEVRHVHDALGRRVATSVTEPGHPPAWTTHVLDGHRIVGERRPDGSTLRFVHGIGLDGLAYGEREDAFGTTPWWYVADDQGSVRALLDGAGSVIERCQYGDYGEPLLTDANGDRRGRPCDLAPRCLERRRLAT